MAFYAVRFVLSHVINSKCVEQINADRIGRRTRGRGVCYHDLLAIQCRIQQSHRRSCTSQNRGDAGDIKNRCKSKIPGCDYGRSENRVERKDDKSRGWVAHRGENP